MEVGCRPLFSTNSRQTPFSIRRSNSLQTCRQVFFSSQLSIQSLPQPLGRDDDFLQGGRRLKLHLLSQELICMSMLVTSTGNENVTNSLFDTRTSLKCRQHPVENVLTFSVLIWLSSPMNRSSVLPTYY